MARLALQVALPRYPEEEIMADTHDPTDHFRTTHPHAGESFIDIYCWPGLLSIALGVMSLMSMAMRKSPFVASRKSPLVAN